MRAVIAESFERIHRSNLVNMGVLPLQFKAGETAASLGLTGREEITIIGVAGGLKPRGDAGGHGDRRGRHGARASPPTCASTRRRNCVAFRHGGILPYVRAAARQRGA